MTSYLIRAQHQYRDLWKAGIYDSTMTLGWVRPGGRGRYFADTIEDLLLGASVAQPSVLESPRKVTRGDLGRLQVALRRSGRDVLVRNAEHLTPWDAYLLNLCTSRAGVNLLLLCEQEPPVGLASWTNDVCVALTGEEALEFLTSRPGHNTRQAPKPCEAALPIGAGTRPTCSTHASATECALESFPHAVATARSGSASIRARLHELTRIDPANQWAIWTHARDTFHGAIRAAEAAQLPAEVVREACLSDLSADGATLNVSQKAHAIPEEPAAVVATQRDIKFAEGFPTDAHLFKVRQAHADRYALGRPGDPAGPVPTPARRRAAS